MSQQTGAVGTSCISVLWSGHLFASVCFVQVGLLAYRYKFGPPTQQKSADRQRLMQQVSRGSQGARSLPAV